MTNRLYKSEIELAKSIKKILEAKTDDLGELLEVSGFPRKEIIEFSKNYKDYGFTPEQKAQIDKYLAKNKEK